MLLQRLGRMPGWIWLGRVVGHPSEKCGLGDFRRIKKNGVIVEATVVVGPWISRGRHWRTSSTFRTDFTLLGVGHFLLDVPVRTGHGRIMLVHGAIKFFFPCGFAAVIVFAMWRKNMLVGMTRWMGVGNINIPTEPIQKGKHHGCQKNFFQAGHRVIVVWKIWPDATLYRLKFQWFFRLGSFIPGGYLRANSGSGQRLG